MRLRALSAALALVGATALTYAAPWEPPPAPRRWVTDEAGLLSAATRDALDARLEAFQGQSGHQVLVFIGTTTSGVPLEDFAVKAFAKWRVGRKGLDDGLVLFVFTEDRRLRIEVGYGLEGAVPDAQAGRIIKDVIAPQLGAGQADAALTAGVDALLAAVSGEGGPAAGVAPRTGGEASAPVPPASSPSGRELGWGETIVFGLIGLVFLVILITNPRLALWILFNVLSAALSGGGGGGGGSRGSFSGGGGRSGGGGASGSW